MNRLEKAILDLAPRVAALDAQTRSTLDTASAVDTQEHFVYQQTQALAHAMGVLSMEEALVIYNALGEVGSAANGGWAEGTDLVTKVVVTKVMVELMGTPA